MLASAIQTVEQFAPSLNFIASFLAFLGGGYVALHSRVIPKWAVTCLWYIGLAGLLNAITFIVQWTLGQTHPLSHFQIGIVSETLLNITIAATVCLLFFHTVWQDYLGTKKRRAEYFAQQQAALNKSPVARKTKAAVKTAARGRVSSSKTIKRKVGLTEFERTQL